MVEKKEKDCAISIMKTARGKWQKNVGEVLIEVEKNIEILKTDYKWVKWLIVSIFGITTLSTISLLVKFVLGG